MSCLEAKANKALCEFAIDFCGAKNIDDVFSWSPFIKCTIIKVPDVAIDGSNVVELLSYVEKLDEVRFFLHLILPSNENDFIVLPTLTPVINGFLTFSDVSALNLKSYSLHDSSNKLKLVVVDSHEDELLARLMGFEHRIGKFNVVTEEVLDSFFCDEFKRSNQFELLVKRVLEYGRL